MKAAYRHERRWRLSGGGLAGVAPLHTLSVPGGECLPRRATLVSVCAPMPGRADCFPQS